MDGVDELAAVRGGDELAAVRGGDEMAAIRGVAFMDGRWVPLAEAAVPILDRGFVRSDATYDVAHVWRGRFFRLMDHVERFQASMAGLRLSLPYSAAQIAGIMTECVARSGLRDAYVQVTCTRGMPPAGTRDPRLCRNRLYVFAQPFVWIADEQQRRDGLHMILSSTQRIPPESLDQRIKNFHWLDLTMGIFEAYDRGATVAAMPAADGSITEGPGFNIFVVKDGAIATPDRGLFEGITRRTVTEIAADLQLRCELRAVRPEELLDADEIFVTSTAGGITPVTQYEGRPVGNGRPGPLTSRITELYWGRHDDPAFSTAVPYAD
jgi:branched-chain amino acid aminotransferase